MKVHFTISSHFRVTLNIWRGSDSFLCQIFGASEFNLCTDRAAGTMLPCLIFFLMAFELSEFDEIEDRERFFYKMPLEANRKVSSVQDGTFLADKIEKALPRFL